MMNSLAQRVIRKLNHIFCSITSSIIRLISILPGVYSIRRLHYKIKFFLGGGSYVRFWGAFDNMDGARKFLDNKCPSAYAETDLTDINLESFSQIHLFDYPVIHWLHQFQNRYRSVIDFGGHVGVKYIAYMDLLPQLFDIQWKVVEVPFAVERGRKIASERGLHNLSFTDSIDGEESDLLFISGAIQYSPQSIDQLLNSMLSIPEFIIINKLPVHCGSDLFTLENFGAAKIIYHIFNKTGFDASLRSRGYDKIDTWIIPSRDITIPFHEDRLSNFEMQGQVWQLSSTAGK